MLRRVACALPTCARIADTGTRVAAIRRDIPPTAGSRALRFTRAPCARARRPHRHVV